ncbi:MAG: hypothetical protein ETSY2_48935 [Candidatus Entotheonella gemina]|uniref:Uncharacterized protein n=1 Tax=Candidatus Entotheonella gemina TaxID=1429439 RepID=W4LA87_9BACT|nr:MAG: hypothetical protein ETSY2_48935 [Candidatus Entotheonella gemina]
MVEAILAPSHSHSFKTLLDEPFTGALNHSRAQRQTQLFVQRIIKVIMVANQVGMHLL